MEETYVYHFYFLFFFFSKIFVPNLSINFSKLNFKFVDKCGEIKIAGRRSGIEMFCFVEGGRRTESGEADDEGKKIHKICIGRVRRTTVHDASGFPRQRGRI